MNHPDFQTADWYQAVALSDRIASWMAIKDRNLNLEMDAEVAQRWIQRWRSQPPFDKDTYFDRRLATANITEAEFLHILGEPIEAVRDRSSNPPDWLIELERAFSDETEFEPIDMPDELKKIPTIDFLNLIEPIIQQGRDRLRAGIQTLIATAADLPFDPNTIETILFANLPQRLLSIVSRTLVLELNVARLQGQLQGDTPEQRFQSFTQRLRQREIALSILQEYPVLARQALLCINHWVTTSLEFLQHLCRDWDDLRSQLSPIHQPGVLVAVSAGEGDSHREGRSVVIAKFSADFRVVYKPRSMSLDVHFQELLHWINERGDLPPFRLLKILDRQDYGWVEHVDAQTCSREEEIHRFYERQGGYLAILYALEATDFHHENLIAAGEHPVLLDLEALFHPRVGGVDLTQAEQLANNMLGYSVFGIGLLPHRIWSSAESAGIDLSGLGSSEGQLTPHEVPRWQGIGTDEMKLMRQRIEMNAADNQPTLNHEKVNVLDYADAIDRGFTSIYHLLLNHRADLLAESGPLASFAGDTVRTIVRATRTYAMLLIESFHPDVLRNALDRDRLFDRLWLAVEHLPHLAKLIATEQEDLWKGDIPMFTTRPESRDLWTSSGKQIPDFLDRSGLASVRERLQQLSQTDLNRQLWIIRASLTSLSQSTGQPKARNTSKQIDSQTTVTRQQYLNAARAIGDRLETLALRGEADASWIGLTLVDDRYWTLTPLGADFYDGLPGVILFLAYLGEIAQDSRYTQLSQAALNTLQRILAQNQAWITQIGGFSGWGGIIYCFSHLGTLWHQPELIDRAEEYVNLLPELIDRDRNFDIIGGAAGCIGGLLALYRVRPSEQTLNVAMHCGEHLLAHAQQLEPGCGWLNPRISSKPLAGFSHGNAGIAWALLELAALSGAERFRNIALDAIAHERSLFSPQKMNWPDLREFETTVRNGISGSPAEMPERDCFMHAWCHGAPGIGLARLQCLQYLDDSKTSIEIKIALQTTLNRGFGRNHSLCHGDLGNLELLLQASKILGEPQWQVQCDRLAATILGSIEQNGWLCGIPLAVESPGLMTGLAGIGYGLLRLAAPDRLPSVLVMAPPVDRPKTAKTVPLVSNVSSV
jgi:type 2 lantibiotic biosynthesis protein LanM